MNMQILRVHHYGETPEEDRRITIAPVNVTTIAAEIEDKQIRDRSLRTVSVLYLDGSSIDLLVDHADLELLESTIGAFCFGD